MKALLMYARCISFLNFSSCLIREFVAIGLFLNAASALGDTGSLRDRGEFGDKGSMTKRTEGRGPVFGFRLFLYWERVECGSIGIVFGYSCELLDIEFELSCSMISSP